MKKINIILLSLTIVIIDQIIKLAVKYKIGFGNSIGNLIKITNVENTGMAFGIRKR